MRVGTRQKLKHPRNDAPQNQQRTGGRKGRDRHESEGAPHMQEKAWTGQSVGRSVLEARGQVENAPPQNVHCAQGPRQPTEPPGRRSGWSPQTPHVEGGRGRHDHVEELMDEGERGGTLP